MTMSKKNTGKGLPELNNSPNFYKQKNEFAEELFQWKSSLQVMIQTLKEQAVEIFKK